MNGPITYFREIFSPKASGKLDLTTSTSSCFTQELPESKLCILCSNRFGMEGGSNSVEQLAFDNKIDIKLHEIV